MWRLFFAFIWTSVSLPPGQASDQNSFSSYNLTAGNQTKVKLTKKGQLEEIWVSIPQDLYPMSSEKPMLWQVYVEIEKIQNNTRVWEGWMMQKKSTNRTLLNVMIVQDDAVKEFQLPGIHVAEREKKKVFIGGHKRKDKASPEEYRVLARDVTMCPGKNIEEDSKLQIILVSTSKSPIEVAVRVTLVEEGRGWEKTTDEAGKKKMQISSKFEFSNPLIHTFRFDQLSFVPNEVEHYIHLRIESDKDSPCFCSLLSIQKAECPYCDTIGDAQKLGRGQTMDHASSTPASLWRKEIGTEEIF